MKTLYFFTDTETTGLLKTKDQILEFSEVFYEKENLLLEKEIKIKIKDNIFPNASALIINNINPFSDEFLKESLTEYEAATSLVNTLLDYSKKGYRIVLVAYNAGFDIDMYRSMFERCGFEINSLIDIIYDPYITAKLLIQEGSLKTKVIESKFGHGKSYQSAKLEDVYNALGYSSESIKAHNALEDTKMLKTACMKLYLLFCGKTFDEANVDLSTFNIGDIKTIVYNEKNMDLKIRTIKILKDTPVGSGLSHGFFVLDYSLLKETNDISKSIIFLEKIKIFDELDIKHNESGFLESNYQKNKEYIVDIVNKKKITELSIYHSHEKVYFDKIIKIAEKKREDKNCSLNDEEILLEELAEDYSYSKYNSGWKSNNYGQNHMNEVKRLLIDDDFFIELDPIGTFNITKNNEKVFESEKKTEILDFLVKKDLLKKETELFKKANSFLIPIKNFKNTKHPIFLIKEFNEKKTEIFNGSNKLHKEILKGLLNHYKKLNSEAFKDLTVPEFKLNLNNFKKKS